MGGPSHVPPQAGYFASKRPGHSSIWIVVEVKNNVRVLLNQATTNFVEIHRFVPHQILQFILLAHGAKLFIDCFKICF